MSQPLRRFFGRFQNWIGILILLNFIGMAVLSRYVPALYSLTGPGSSGQTLTLEEQHIKNELDRKPLPPSSEHPLGTLVRQMDILDGLVSGTRQALEFSLKAGLISAAIGLRVGAVSAYAGGWVNGLVLRISDGMLAVPLIAMLVMIQQVKAVMFAGLSEGDLVFSSTPGGQTVMSEDLQRAISFDPLLWAIIAVNWVPYTRMINARILILKEATYIQAAHAMGASPWRIIWRHLLPNAIAPTLVLLARDLGWLVILQASLQYAGFGGGSVWGAQLLQGRDWIIGPGGNPFGYWWVWLPGTVVLILYGLAWNLIGDGLNEALNPKPVAQYS